MRKLFNLDKDSLLKTLIIVVLITISILIITPIFSSFSVFFSFLFKFLGFWCILSAIHDLYQILKN